MVLKQRVFDQFGLFSKLLYSCTCCTCRAIMADMYGTDDTKSMLPRLSTKSSDPMLDRRTSMGSHEKKSMNGLVSKGLLIVFMTLVWSGYSLTLSYTRRRSDRPKYASTTVVFVAEFVKLFIASLCLLRTHNYSLTSTKMEFITDFLHQPVELLKMAVPSVAYALQNNLDFVALSNLDPGVYQVTCQLKVLTTAVFMVLLLGRRYSLARWLAIMLLFGGVALVQLDAVESKQSAVNAPAAISAGGLKNHTEISAGFRTGQNYIVGITAVLATCLTAGFAGVYFERMLKDATASLWIRNMQMYFCGTISAGLGCLLKESDQIMEHGFFQGYDGWVWFIVGLLSVGGISISLVIKYLDNLLKSFASAVSISVVSLVSFYAFGTILGIYFVLGSCTVCAAILLYNSVPD